MRSGEALVRHVPGYGEEAGNELGARWALPGASRPECAEKARQVTGIVRRSACLPACR